MNTNNFNDNFFIGIARSIEPIQIAFNDRLHLKGFIKELGYNIPITDDDLTKLETYFGLTSSFQEIFVLIKNIKNKSGSQIENVKTLFSKLKTIIEEVKQLGTNPNNLPPPFNGDNTFWSEFLENLVNRLVARGLEDELPIVYSILHLVGIINRELETPVGLYRVPFQKYTIHWNKLGSLFSDPLNLLKETYKWDNQVDSFAFQRFLSSVRQILLHAGFRARMNKPFPTLLDNFFDVGNKYYDEIEELNIPLILQIGPGFVSVAELGIKILPIPSGGIKSGVPNGFIITPLVHGELESNSTLNSSFQLEFSSSIKADGAFQVVVTPDGVNLKVEPGITAINSKISLKGKPTSPYSIIGSEQSSRIELDGFFLSLSFKGTPTAPEFEVELGTSKSMNDSQLRFILQAKEGDGFIKKIVGDKSKAVIFAGSILWSSKTGLLINGSIGFNFQLPLHQALGPFRFKGLQFTTLVDGEKNVMLTSGVSIGGKLGPIDFLVEDIGAKLLLQQIKEKNKSGLLGNLDIDFGFKAPSGIGININTAAVKGGGYLYINQPEGRYAGVASLSIKNKIQLSAFGLINTKLPDGQKGFSFLLFISAEFSPIQIGMGFTLNGVGGIVGIHRTVVVETLRTGVRTGAYNRLLFPANPVEDALEIIGDLRAIFPPKEGRHVFGIMGKLGWGSPTLITAEIGLIIEVPNPIRFAILGVLNCVLPSPTKRLLELNVNFLGVIDFGKKQLSFDATIYDSSLLKKFTLSGDMALRVSWGSQRNFLLSVGGFHPSFQPPPQLISMRRLTLSLLGGNNPRLTLTTYFAVTSNTVQFGARVDVYVKVTRKLSVEGYLGFDVLFQFNPFYFHILVYAYFAVKWKGKEKFSISVHISLEGPRPWIIDGHAQIRVLGMGFKVRIQKTWGLRENTTLASVEVSGRLQDALEEIRNWSVQLPPNQGNLVQTRKLTIPDGIILVQPTGTLQISQKVLPLNLSIQLFGTQNVSDGGVYEITELHIGETSADTEVEHEYVKEEFVPAHFKKMSQAQKLSSPSFVKFDSGVKIKGGTELDGGGFSKKEVEYETIVFEAEKRIVHPEKVKEWKEVMEAMVQGGVSGRASLSHSRRRAPLGPKTITIQEEKYGVVWKNDLKLIATNALRPSYAEAIDYYTNHVTANIGDKSKLKILPEFEIV